MLRRLLLSLLVLSTSALADTVYIIDVLYVPLRGGQSQEHRIVHRGLKSGTELERLVTNEESGYTRVRMEDGTEGWLPTQYIVDEPIAADRLVRLQAELEPGEIEHQQTLLELRTLREDNERLTEANEQLSTELTELKALSARVIEINDQNMQLKEDVSDVTSQMDDILTINAELESSNSRQWFLMGGGTVLIGLLFGFWIGRRIYHKRNTGGWA